MVNQQVRKRELEYHQEIYAGFALQHFARTAVHAFRAHLVNRILVRPCPSRSTRVLSLDCRIGDTEFLLAPHVGRVTAIDLSSTAVAGLCRASRLVDEVLIRIPLLCLLVSNFELIARKAIVLGKRGQAGSIGLGTQVPSYFCHGLVQARIVRLQSARAPPCLSPPWFFSKAGRGRG